MEEDEQKLKKSFKYKEKTPKKEKNSNSQKEKCKIKEIEKNKIIDDYIIKDTIGKGTFSTVKLGEHIKTKQKVAIKILNKDKIKENEDLLRVKREIKILSMMDHPNIIKTYKITESPKNYYIIMEYCNGGELFNYIVDKEKLEENEASMFFYQLINALDYIHSLGIAHRDLKPENLLLLDNKFIKIIDFGLSNFFSGEKQLETPCGSPSYAPPEIIKGEKYNGFYIDIWASGIILFAMLCGYLPFDDDEEEEEEDEDENENEGNNCEEDNITSKSRKDHSIDNSDDSDNNEVLFQKILEGKLEYPSHLSKDSIDLMKKILVIEPQKRIQIKDIKKHKFYLLGQKNYILRQKSFSKNNHISISHSIDKIMESKIKKKITNESKENSLNYSLPSEINSINKSDIDEKYKYYNYKISKIKVKTKEELKNEMEEYEKKLFENYLRKVINIKKGTPFLRKKNKLNIKIKNLNKNINKDKIYSNVLKTINASPVRSSINKNEKKIIKNKNNQTVKDIILNFNPHHNKLIRKLESPLSRRYNSNDNYEIKYKIPLIKISQMIRKNNEFPINLNKNIYKNNENNKYLIKENSNLNTINIPEINPKRRNNTENKLLNSINYCITNGNYNKMNEINKYFINSNQQKFNSIDHTHDIEREKMHKPYLPIIKTSLFNQYINNGIIHHNKDSSLLSPGYHMNTEATNRDAKKRIFYIGNRNDCNNFSNIRNINEFKFKLFHPKLKNYNISSLKGIY